MSRTRLEGIGCTDERSLDRRCREVDLVKAALTSHWPSMQNDLFPWLLRLANVARHTASGSSDVTRRCSSV